MFRHAFCHPKTGGPALRRAQCDRRGAPLRKRRSPVPWDAALCRSPRGMPNRVFGLWFAWPRNGACGSGPYQDQCILFPKVVSADRDTVITWDAKTGAKIFVFRVRSFLTEDDDHISSLAFDEVCVCVCVSALVVCWFLFPTQVRVVRAHAHVRRHPPTHTDTITPTHPRAHTHARRHPFTHTDTIAPTHPHAHARTHARTHAHRRCENTNTHQYALQVARRQAGAGR